MVHSFIFDCPAVLDIQAAEKGDNVLQWRPELGTRIGIMPRNKANQLPIWLTTSAFFIFHLLMPMSRTILLLSIMYATTA